jgi:short-subunit dehydrogenase
MTPISVALLFVILFIAASAHSTEMAFASKPLALIVGVGDGLSASLARLLHSKGYRLALASRDPTKFASLAQETEAESFAVDSSNIQDVAKLFDQLNGPLEVAIYNPSYRVSGAITEVDPEQVKKAIEITAFGSFLVAQKAAAAMLANGKGTILFTGASAGVKGFPKSASFAMGKFAQRGLAESMARELHPQNVHVCWINVSSLLLF